MLSQKKNKLLSFLNEDTFKKDITTSSINFYPETTVTARIRFKENGVLAGIDFAIEIFNIVANIFRDNHFFYKKFYSDSDEIKKNSIVLEITGNPKTILSSERTVLNLLSHLSGISTLSNKIKKISNNTKVALLDTRKTLPGLRDFEKYAVKIGGLTNHRMNLSDGYLFKDNHWMLISKNNQNIIKIIDKIKKKSQKEIIVEVKNQFQLDIIIKSKADIIMLDNMSVPELKKSINKIRKYSNKKIELSGNINSGNILKYIALKPDRISMGFLTHSAKSLDISMKIIN